jgi:DNA-binding CsgD family transcriptional regulator/PAS domain-containing protein
MDAALPSLIGLAYDAALDPRSWETFLHSYAAAVDARTAVLLYHDVRQQFGGVSNNVGLDPDAVRSYNEHFAKIDPWFLSATDRGVFRTGEVFTGEEVISRSTLAGTEYFNDFARVYGLTRVLAGVIRRDGNVISTISSVRLTSQESFSDKERRILTALIPHLQRAMQVYRRLSALEGANQATLDVLDRMPIGVIAVRKDGGIAFANRSAGDILNARDGLTSEANGLRATVPAEHRALQALLQSAAAVAEGKAVESSGAMTVSRKSAGEPLSILVTPLRSSALAELRDESCVAAVFVTDPNRPPQTDVQILRELWGLTPTEATIAVKLASGLSISMIAAEMSITDGTARWHVKRVLAKTNTTRQADLVRVLASSPAAVRRRHSESEK